MADHNVTQPASDSHAEYKKRMADAEARADRIAACKAQVDRDEAEFLKEVNRRPEIAKSVIGEYPILNRDGITYKRDSDGKLSGTYADPDDHGLQRSVKFYFDVDRRDCRYIK